jgi:hypothetical protein
MEFQNQGQEDLSWILDKLSMAKKTSPGSPASKSKFRKATFEELKNTRVTELDLWKKWKDSGEKPEHLGPLLKSLKPIIEKKTRGYKALEIPASTIDFHAKQLALKAFQAYKPENSALHTWVTWNLRQLDRYVKKNQNIARIPEPVAAKIGRFKALKTDITDRLGYEPDTHTLSKETGFTIREIKRLEKTQRKQLIASGDANDIQPESSIADNARLEEVKLLIYPELTKEEQSLYEYLYGMYGKPKITGATELAKKLKWDISKVSKKRTDIANKMKTHLF